VAQAVRRWAAKIAARRPEVSMIGYFGSYARGDWGVGSDLDLVIILDKSAQPFEVRSGEFDTLELPVPADVLVYTEEEWQGLQKERPFIQTLVRETSWVFRKEPKQ
jgi:predicted nucleotidyltransferase